MLLLLLAVVLAGGAAAAAAVVVVVVVGVDFSVALVSLIASILTRALTVLDEKLKQEYSWHGRPSTQTSQQCKGVSLTFTLTTRHPFAARATASTFYQVPTLYQVGTMLHVDLAFSLIAVLCLHHNHA